MGRRQRQMGIRDRLRKVAGEVNPADLFTKHSLSRQRLEQLVELHGCRHMGGRAASAPLAKTGESNNATMASGLSHFPIDIGAVSGLRLLALAALTKPTPVGLGVGGAASSAGCGGGTPLGSGPSGDADISGSGAPTMHHLSLTPRELHKRHPSMRAPADDRMEDVLKDEDDTVFKHGMQIAAEIRAAMRANGRTRYRATTDFVGLLCEPVSSVAGPRAAVPRDTSHGERRPWYPQRGADVPPGTVVESLERSLQDLKKTNEPNTEKEKVELHHRAGLISPVRQACTEDQMEEEINDDDDNNNNGYLPVANAICRRSAKVRYLRQALQLLPLQLRPLRHHHNCLPHLRHLHSCPSSWR